MKLPSATIERIDHAVSRMFSKSVLLAVARLRASTAAGAQAQQATEIQLSYKDKKFTPAEITAPANTAFVIKLKNLDAKAMEFESKTVAGREGGRRKQPTPSSMCARKSPAATNSSTNTTRRSRAARWS